jgi:phosphoserine aminotransferase
MVMKNIYFTVGPTQLHPRLEEFMRDAFEEDVLSMSHRGEKFAGLVGHTIASAKRLLNVPEDFHVFFVGSGTEGMERIIENCVEEHSFHLVNGSFSKRFFETAQELKKQPEKIKVEGGKGFDFSAIVLPPASELVCLTQNETSVGTALDMRDIHALKKRYPDKLFAIDIVSSAPFVDVDYSLIDCAFFSVQKGFGMPAGLGVLIVNDACIAKAKQLEEKGMNIGSYHNFPVLLGYEAKHQTPETPNVLGIYLLGRICDYYNEYGIEKIRKETEEKAKLIYDFFDSHTGLSPFVQNPVWRSEMTIVIDTPGGSGPVMKKLADVGFIVSSGYGKAKDAQIRIANFPMHTLKDVEGMLGALGA